MTSVCVHGLGYIGLPTAAMMANHGYEVYGRDIDESVTNGLRNGEVHIDEPGLRAFVTESLESNRLHITEEPVPASYHIICVATPFDTTTRRADLRAVEAVCEAIVPVLREGDTVILESTVPPGTTENRLRPILETHGLIAGCDFDLAHCPETVLPGNIIAEMRQNSRIIGGINDHSATAAVRLYESFVDGEIHTVNDATTAEFVKLIQNTFRDTNIALANELATIAHDYGIDSREAIGLANEHPRVSLHQPGPGVGGHCLPVDPWFLADGSDRLDLIETARRVNDAMPGFIIDLLRDELGSLADCRLAVFGIAYKGNVDDTRMSPGLRLVRELREGPLHPVVPADGGQIDRPSVAVHDPCVGDADVELVPVHEAVTGADGLVITADHDAFADLDPDDIGELMDTKLVVDTKAILDADRWRSTGFIVRRV